MATIINNPGNQGSNEGFGTGLIITVFIMVLLGSLFFIYGLPTLRATEENRRGVQEIQIQVPAATVETES